MTEVLKNQLLLTCDVPTPAGRVYPRKVMEEALSRVQFPLYGEYDIASQPLTPERAIVTQLERISHQIVRADINADGEVRGDIVLLGSFKEEMKNGPRFALRSVVAVDKDGYITNCRIVTFDAVASA
jgi:hypothetical protein